MAKGKYRSGASRRSLLQQFGAAAIGISFSGSLSACGQGGGGRVVNFYNWDTYIGPTTLADFQAATDVPVNMTLFATNDGHRVVLKRRLKVGGDVSLIAAQRPEKACEDVIKRDVVVAWHNNRRSTNSL